jgi:ferritin-like metal-binding protein YciE
MSENTTKPDTHLRELHTIRDILMGQEIADYASRFKQIDELFLATERANTQRFEAEHQFVETQIAQLNQRIDELTRHTNERFDRLEQLLNSNVAAINERVSKVSTSDKAELGKMLASMAQRLASEE